MKPDDALIQQFSIKGGDFANAGDVSCRIKNLLKEIGLGTHTVRRAAIATYEAEMNVIMYARFGKVEVSISPESIRIIIEDEGPGIENIELAMQEGYSTATEKMRELGFGAGMGLPNIKRNSDNFLITSRVGLGTRLEITINTNGKKHE
jgi:anti-sigma regulatory factor (Ser/Thr protein kinase)